MELMSALRNRNLEEAKRLIENGADVNYKDRFGCTPLHVAMNSSLIGLLIEKGADINAVDNNGCTPVNNAVHADYVATFLYFNADISIPNKRGFTRIMRGDNEVVELLLDYEYDFNHVNVFGSSPLTIALILESPHIEAMVQRGGNFSNLFYDTQLLTSTIFRRQVEEFKWLWDSFKYKESWKYKTSILDCALLCHEIFDYIIESPKVEDVIESIYNYNAESAIPFHQSEAFSIVSVLKAINSGYSEKKAHQAIYILFSYGYLPSEREVFEIFERFGYCHLFELCLHMDVLKSGARYGSLLPEVLLNPTKDLNMIIYKFIIDDYFFRRESPRKVIPYIYYRRLIEKWGTFKKVNRSLLKQLRQRSVPSLLELSRNELRRAICKRFNIKNTRQFYTTVKWMPTEQIIKDILTFKVPVYQYGSH